MTGIYRKGWFARIGLGNARWVRWKLHCAIRAAAIRHEGFNDNFQRAK